MCQGGSCSCQGDKGAGGVARVGGEGGQSTIDGGREGGSAAFEGVFETGEAAIITFFTGEIYTYIFDDELSEISNVKG